MIRVWLLCLLSIVESNLNVYVWASMMWSCKSVFPKSTFLLISSCVLFHKKKCYLHEIRWFLTFGIMRSPVVRKLWTLAPNAYSWIWGVCLHFLEIAFVFWRLEKLTWFEEFFSKLVFRKPFSRMIFSP